MSKDQTANAIVKIKNALLTGKPIAEVILNNLNVALVRILEREGYVENFTIFNSKGFFMIRIPLKYRNSVPAIKDIRQISKPGSRVYEQVRVLRNCSGGMGINVIATPKGIVTDKLARKLRVGGEIICSVF